MPQVMSELVDSCRNHDYTDVVIVHEHRGEPDGMIICHLPYGPTAYFGLFNTVRRGEFGGASGFSVGEQEDLQLSSSGPTFWKL